MHVRTLEIVPIFETSAEDVDWTLAPFSQCQPEFLAEFLPSLNLNPRGTLAQLRKLPESGVLFLIIIYDVSVLAYQHFISLIVLYIYIHAWF